MRQYFVNPHESRLTSCGIWLYDSIHSNTIVNTHHIVFHLSLLVALRWGSQNLKHNDLLDTTKPYFYRSQRSEKSKIFYDLQRRWDESAQIYRERFDHFYWFSYLWVSLNNVLIAWYKSLLLVTTGVIYFPLWHMRVSLKSRANDFPLSFGFYANF